MRHEKVRRRQKWALCSPASQLRARKAALARRLRRCGGGGRDREGRRSPCPAQLRCQPRCPSAGGGVGLRAHVRLLYISEHSHPQNPKPTPRAIRIGACLVKSHNSMCGPCSRRRRCADIPPIGRTRPVKSSGAASRGSRTRAQTDKEIVKEKFGVANYKTESLKKPAYFWQYFMSCK